MLKLCSPLIPTQQTEAPPAPARTPGQTGGPPRHRELAGSYLAAVGLLAILFGAYFAGLPGWTTGVGRYYVPLGILSDAALLGLVPLALCFFGPYWPAAPGRRRTLVGLVFGLVFVFFLADVIIFRLFRRHFDGLIWNVIVTPGAADSLQAGTASFVIGAVLIVVMLGLGQLVAHRMGPRLASWPKRYWIPLLLVVMLVERSVFAVGHLKEVVEITRVQEFLPYYLPITIKRLATRFGYKLGERVEPRLTTEGGAMNYPLHPLQRDPSAPLYNVVVIAVEGGRFDVLTPEVMPRVHAFAQESWQLRQHYSSGAATRFGIFGLLYGIPATYWHRALSERRSPVLIDELKRLGYGFQILSCTDLNFPEFRSTAFVNVRDAISDRWEGERVERDRKMTDQFLASLASRTNATASPFFSFLFYDASHQPYSFPPEDAVISGSYNQPEINYAKLAMSPVLARALKSRYLNSLHYVDRLIGRVIDGLRQGPEWDRTIVVIVGDHGEEFGELGGFGHNTSYNRYQTQTLAVLRLPGAEPKSVEAITCHTDIVPTLLTTLGYTNDVRHYSVGLPLSQVSGDRQVVLGGWRSAALMGAECITVFEPVSVAFYDHAYRDLAKGDPRRHKAGEVLAALDQLKVFLK